jgi:hypothetical protein
MAGDGNVYYSLIRHLKPRRIVEVGSGNSTLLASHAIEKCAQEYPGFCCDLIAIEPHPADYLVNIAALTELRRVRLQQTDLAFFETLEAGDILFIDSSHVLKSGGDVWYAYCEIIPRLKPGIYVHLHDISLPKPYPAVYHDAHIYWNEQYILQALLTGNKRLEVVWAGTYLFKRHCERMQQLFAPEFEQMRSLYPQAEPSSFWLRVVS